MRGRFSWIAAVSLISFNLAFNTGCSPTAGVSGSAPAVANRSPQADLRRPDWALSPSAAATPSSTCADESEGWHYCVHRYSGGNPDTIYYVHGYTNSHYGWTESWSEEHMARMRELQSKLGENSPTVVVISYAGGFTSWLLSIDQNRTRDPRLATLEHFTQVAMPKIENQYGLKGRRILYGMSMGGFNAAQLCLHQPDLWSKCLLQNAMLPSCDPFASPMDYMCFAGYMIRSNFSAAEWARNNPAQFAQGVDVARLPRIFVSSATDDEFRLFEGGRAFARTLQGRGARVQWHEVQGDHGAFDAEAVYQFMTGP